MHKVCFRFIVTLLLVFTALLYGIPQPTLAEQEVVRIALDTWCPYICDPESEDGKLGFIPDVIVDILQKHDFQVETALMPYSRSIYELREGTWHISPGMAKPNAPDFIFSPNPVVYNTYHFYVKKGSTWRFEGVESLEKLNNVGLIQDYSYNEMGEAMAIFMERHPERLDWMTGDEPLARNIKKLLVDRVDAIIADRWTATYQLEKLQVADQVIEVGYLGDNYPIHIGYSPTHPHSMDYARMIDEGIQQLKASGEIQTFLDKYGLTEEVYTVPTSEE